MWGPDAEGDLVAACAYKGLRVPGKLMGIGSVKVMSAAS